jgi:hypothetical protein
MSNNQAEIRLKNQLNSAKNNENKLVSDNLTRSTLFNVENISTTPLQSLILNSTVTLPFKFGSDATSTNPLRLQTIPQTGNHYLNSASEILNKIQLITQTPKPGATLSAEPINPFANLTNYLTLYPPVNRSNENTQTNSSINSAATKAPSSTSSSISASAATGTFAEKPRLTSLSTSLSKTESIATFAGATVGATAAAIAAAAKEAAKETAKETAKAVASTVAAKAGTSISSTSSSNDALTTILNPFHYNSSFANSTNSTASTPTEPLFTFSNGDSTLNSHRNLRKPARRLK